MTFIFGGAFNPPTYAHYEIALLLQQKFSPDRIIFLPVGDNYRKKELMPFKYRFEMCQIIANKIPACFVSDNDNTPDYQGTYRVLNTFLEEDKEIYFILGADNLLELHNWLNAPKLVHEFKFIVISRNDLEIEKYLNQYFPVWKDKFSILNYQKDISSSNARQNKDLATSLVLPEVLDYIKEKKLYWSDF